MVSYGDYRTENVEPLAGDDRPKMTEVYEPIEKCSIDELRSLQEVRLAQTLRTVYDKVPHYRRAFDQAGVAPGDFTDLADLAKFPFLTKADLRHNYPFGMFAVPLEQINRLHASSGTTGKPTVVGYTSADLETWATVVARSIFAAGGRPGDMLHNAYGYGLFTGGLGPTPEPSCWGARWFPSPADRPKSRSA